MNDTGDPALLLLVGKGLSVDKIAVRLHREKQPRTVYVSVKINPLDVVYGEVNLHALTGDGLDISVGNAKVVSLPPLGVVELGAETGILIPTEKTS